MTIRSQYAALAVLLLLTAVYAVTMTALFTDRPDEWRALPIFAQALLDTERPDELGLAWMRVLFLIADVVLCVSLALTGLVTRRTLAFAAVWPMTVYLFSKLYWEFWVFPLCLVRLDLTRRQELGFIAALLSAFALTHEGNVLVLIAFRCVLLCQKIGFVRLAPLVFAGLGIAIDQYYDVAVQTISLPFVQDELVRFQYIREIVNPEYSMIETAGVFISSVHFFTLHTEGWVIDAAFSLLALAFIASSPHARRQIKANRHVILSIVCVVIAMTEITHGFQNARYYYFFVPLLAKVTPLTYYPVIALLGLAHVAIKAAL